MFSLTQMPGEPIKLERQDMRTFIAEAGMTFQIIIKEYGVEDCSATGEELNPLREEYNGSVNPYQDPARGRVPTLTIDA